MISIGEVLVLAACPAFLAESGIGNNVALWVAKERPRFPPALQFLRWQPDQAAKASSA